MQFFLPLVDELTNAAVAEIEVGQLVGKIDRLRQVAVVRATLGELVEDFLDARRLEEGRRRLRERLKYTASPSSAVRASASRFMKANISTSLLPSSCAIAGTRPCASHLT